MANTEKVGILTHIDDDGNKTELYPVVKTDSTLKETGTPADAAATGEAIAEATNIAKGRNRARVFATTADMESWLKDAANKGVCIVGDNLYIVQVDVPDWWVSEVLTDADSTTGYYYKIAQLETQKVDLTTIQTQLNNKLDKGGHAVNKAVVTDGNGNIAPTGITSAEIGTLSGVTSNIQTQLDGKLSTAGGTMTGTLTSNNVYPATSSTYNSGRIANPWAGVYANNHTVIGTDNKSYVVLKATNGTTSNTGTGDIWLGTNIAAGTAGNAKGRIIMYNSGKVYAVVQDNDGATANRTLTLPTKGGTIPVASLSGTTLTINF